MQRDVRDDVAGKFRHYPEFCRYVEAVRAAGAEGAIR
jgi:hypothetical protein